MAVRIVRLGGPRSEGEGVRLGTVRRPPRGVPKSAYGMQDWYDVWLPNLAPSAQTMKLGQQVETELDWRSFTRAYRHEMSQPDASRVLDTLAALSHGANFSMGCYCQDEAQCHRSILKALLQDRGASLA